jgi:uncharacterized protein
VTPTVVLIPGWQDSGPDHWQSRWVRAHPDYLRLRQRDWEHPDRDEWVATLDATLAALDGPAVLAAHSLGCQTVVHWAARRRRPVRGALLVAPPDVERPDIGKLIPGWSPLPLAPLPFPSVIVASADDPYCALDRTRAFAAAWGSKFVDIGHLGHINADAGLGPWPQGERLLAELMEHRA